MSRSVLKPAGLVVLIAAGLLVGACGADKKAGRAGNGGGLSFASITASDGCNYHSARADALELLERAGAIRQSHPDRAAVYERRASAVISAAESCQKRKGLKTYSSVGRR